MNCQSDRFNSIVKSLCVKSRTVAQLPGHPVLFGLTVLQQRAGVAAVPGVVSGSEQSVQSEDQIHPRTVGEGVQQIYSVLFHRKKTAVTTSVRGVTLYKIKKTEDPATTEDNVYTLYSAVK